MRAMTAWIVAVLVLLGLTTASPPVGAAVTRIAEYDFEDGTAQGWRPRGSDVSVTATDAAAHSGEGALLVTGRTANWHGAEIAPPFEPGVVYQVTAWARLVTGQPAATIALTVQRTPAGGDTVYERVAAATVTDSGWVELTGQYSYDTDSTDLVLYAESSDPTGEYYLDDIVITADADPTTSGLVSDFETGSTQGWVSRAAATVSVTTAQAHSGRYSLFVTDRADFWDGPSRNILGKMAKGSKYELEAWVRLGEGVSSGKLGLSLERRAGDTPSYEQVVAPKTIPPGEWVQLKGTYTLAHDVDFLSVYVESDTGTFDFYLDDFSLTYLPPTPIQTDIPAVKDTVPFLMGAAIQRPQTLGEHSKLLTKHFNSVTPGNQLKWDATEPREGEFTFAEGDYLVDYARAHGLQIRGHTLVWHEQTPEWVFKDGDRDLQATPQDKALLLKRLENHIRAVAGRYKGKIYAWDVVNEVIDENQSDGLRRSKWFQITGLDYIRTAFRVAREVDPNAKLFINDYNTEWPNKREALYKVVRQLLDEGVPIDGVGHQLHLNIEQPPTAEVEKTIQRFADLGVDQQITELDVSVYTDSTSSWPSIPEEVLIAQGHRYKALFDVFRRHADKISSVTTWGLADDDTWLSWFPITRLNAPLLFDQNLQAKPAYWAVVDPDWPGSAGPSPSASPSASPSVSPSPSPSASPSPSPSASPSPSPSPSPSISPSPSPSASPSAVPAGCIVRYRILSQWPGGFQGEVTITNTASTTLNGWTLTWSFADGQQVTQLWNGTVTQTGARVTVKNADWNGLVASGQSTSFGFLGSWAGTNTAPTAFTLNGTACTTG